MKAPSIDDFTIIKPISRGAFGKVFLAFKNEKADRKYAIKVIKKSDLINKNMTYQVVRERNALAITRSPFCVHLYYFLQSPGSVYLVMEYLIGGDLKSLLAEYQIFDQRMAVFYVSEIVLALEYLHSHGIVHRDLKPDNMLLTATGHLKLTDFGLSKVNVHRELQVADLIGTTPFVQRCQAQLRTPGQIMSLTSKISFTQCKALPPPGGSHPDVSTRSGLSNQSLHSADGSMTGLEPLQHSPVSESSFIHSCRDFPSLASYRIKSDSCSSFEQLRQHIAFERTEPSQFSINIEDSTNAVSPSAKEAGEGCSVREEALLSPFSRSPELLVMQPPRTPDSSGSPSSTGKAYASDYSVSACHSRTSRLSPGNYSAASMPLYSPGLHDGYVGMNTGGQVGPTPVQNTNLLSVPDSWSRTRSVSEYLPRAPSNSPILDVSPHSLDCQESPVRGPDPCSCCPGSSDHPALLQTPNRDDCNVLTSSPTFVYSGPSLDSGSSDSQNLSPESCENPSQQDLASPEILRLHKEDLQIVDKFITTMEQSLNVTGLWVASPNEAIAKPPKLESFKKPETKRTMRKRKLGMTKSPDAKRPKVAKTGLTERIVSIKVSEIMEKHPALVVEDRKPLSDIGNTRHCPFSSPKLAKLAVPTTECFKKMSKNTSHLSLMDTTGMSHGMSDTRGSDCAKSERGSYFSEPRATSPNVRTPFRQPKRMFDSPPSDGCILGTPDYLAPELLLKTNGHDPAVDWWSLGICLYEFLLGCPPFNDETPELIFSNILRRNVEFPPEDDDCLSQEARAVIETLLTLDPEQRGDGIALRTMTLFRSIDWINLHNAEAPFLPQPKNDSDTGYFQVRNNLQNLNVSSLTP